MKLLAPIFECPTRGEELDDVRSHFELEAGRVKFEDSGWRPEVAGEVLTCKRGHCFQGRYEQIEPWMRKLVGVGEPVMPGFGN